MTHLNENQKDIQNMFNEVNTKSISNKKYESLINKISEYADLKGESKFFKKILLEEILYQGDSL